MVGSSADRIVLFSTIWTCAVRPIAPSTGLGTVASLGSWNECGYGFTVVADKSWLGWDTSAHADRSIKKERVE